MRLTDKESIVVLGLLRLKRKTIAHPNEYIDRTKTRILEHIYLLAPRPSSVTIHDISILLNVSSHFIRVWFIRRNQQSIAKPMVKDDGETMINRITVNEETNTPQQTLKVRVLMDIYEDFYKKFQ
ncbi:Homeobox protein HD-8 [Nosema granulosis]|uniref:Homeobox protein HD-8 n=1 Tax=Nosema granulosis TaxID=83296 RepID=A0A9P6L014_9MICR|nr:Homeobox protein HD-8 [Nosema granulosis]